MSDITQEQVGEALADLNSWANGIYAPRHQHKNLEIVGDERQQHIKRIEELEGALNNIENPITYLRREAEKDGAKLNGAAAVSLAEDASFLKGIARQALSTNEDKGE